jgi:hypothetical protein
MADPTWIHEAVHFRQKGYSRKKIAELMQLPEYTIKNLLGKARKAWLKGTIPVPDMQATYPIINERAELIDAEMDRRGLLRDTRENRQDIGREVISVAVASELALLLGQHHAELLETLKAIRNDIQVPINRGKHEEAWLVVSDLHHMRNDNGVDETTTSSALHAYDDHTGRILKMVREYATVETANIALLGDLIHGVANYLYQDRETSGNSSQQIARTAWLLIDFICRQRERYSFVNVYCVPGNHGRKSDRQNVYNDNLELDMYRIIEAYFANDSQVVVQIADRDFKLVATSLGYRYLLMHGNSIKAGNPQALIDNVRKYEAIIEPFDSVLMGHWHRFMRLPLPRRYGETNERSIYVNGTASKDDTFLTSFGSSPSLSWWLLFNNAKRVTSTWDIPLYG